MNIEWSNQELFIVDEQKACPVCKCGQQMIRTKRSAYNINGWICMGMVCEIVNNDFDLAAAKQNHTPPINLNQ